MPMMTELLEKIQENPPQDEQGLRELLDETGYDLVMKEPGGDEEASEEKPMPGENPRIKVRRMTVIAANKAMKGKKKGR